MSSRQENTRLMQSYRVDKKILQTNLIDSRIKRVSNLESKMTYLGIDFEMMDEEVEEMRMSSQRLSLYEKAMVIQNMIQK